MQPFHITSQTTWCPFKLLRGLAFWGWWRLQCLTAKCHHKHSFPRLKSQTCTTRLKLMMEKVWLKAHGLLQLPTSRLVHGRVQSTWQHLHHQHPTVALEGKGLDGFLRKIISKRHQRGEEDQTPTPPRKHSERRDQGLPVSAIHSSRWGSTGVVEGLCIRVASPCQCCEEAFVHPSNQCTIRVIVQCQRAHCLPS